MHTLSPQDDDDDFYDESESAAPTPLASSFPVPPAFPTLRPSLSVSVANANSNSNPINGHEAQHSFDADLNANANERATPMVKRYHAPGTSDSSRSTIAPLHFRGLSLEERIRQLRVLGVDVGVPGALGEGAMQERGPMANVVPVPVEKESDDESLCSGSYYSARSSFSSERVGLRCGEGESCGGEADW